LDHILIEEKVEVMLSRLDELGLLRAIHPALVWDDWLHSRIYTLRSTPPDPGWGLSRQFERPAHQKDLIYILWLVRLPADQIRKIIARIKLPAALARNVLAAHRLWMALPNLVGLKPSAADEQLGDISLLPLYALFLGAEQDEQRRLVWNHATSWRKINPKLSGHDLRARGLPPGPIYKEILKSLRAAWLDGEIGSKDQEEVLLEELIQRFNSKNGSFIAS
jgi:tRNA nucleotidyltransferase (CCA-adding enzyme)